MGVCGWLVWDYTVADITDRRRICDVSKSSRTGLIEGAVTVVYCKEKFVVRAPTVISPIESQIQYPPGLGAKGAGAFFIIRVKEYNDPANKFKEYSDTAHMRHYTAMPIGSVLAYQLLCLFTFLYRG